MKDAVKEEINLDRSLLLLVLVLLSSISSFIVLNYQKSDTAVISLSLFVFLFLSAASIHLLKAVKKNIHLLKELKDDSK